VDLPTTVVIGQEFSVVVRRVTTRRSPQTSVGRQPVPAVALAASRRQPGNWRYVTGTFQIRIPVGSPATLLGPERNTLAILKWRLLKMSPASRWYPVLQRYVVYLGARVSELGDDPDTIPASPLGYWETPTGAGGEGRSYTGKITEVIFNCRGRMEGFVLRECCDREYRFTACDRDLEDIVLRACTGRFEVTIQSGKEESQPVQRLIVRW
jgi:hypothetical protein